MPGGVVLGTREREERRKSGRESKHGERERAGNGSKSARFSGADLRTIVEEDLVFLGPEARHARARARAVGTVEFFLTLCP